MNHRLTTHNLDDFAVITLAEGQLDASLAQDCLQEITQLSADGAKLIFLDLSSVTDPNASELEALSNGIARLKQMQKFEFVIVTEPASKAKIASSALAAVGRIYEPKDAGAAQQTTRILLAAEFGKIASTLDRYMIDAVKAGVQRWMGSVPEQIEPSAPEVDPIQDVVSSVTMNIDGGEFRLYLASSQPVMLAMVAKILKTQVKAGDPLIADGACELLNYLTAYFRQRLGVTQTAVDASAPKLMQPDEIMVLLDQSPKGHRVHTELGHFDVWIEVAA